MSTIYNIAKETGLSPSTVARALRGTGYCSQENREKVLAMAKQLGYRPMQAAKVLKTKRTNKILFCIPDISNTFYFKMITGVTSALEKFNYYTLICYTKQNPEYEFRMIQNLSEHYGDGMIMVSINVTEELVDAINQCNMPVVLASRYEHETSRDVFDNIYTDTELGIKIATEHLVSFGHKRIGYVGGSQKTTLGNMRLQGYKKAMAEAGLDIDERFVLEGNLLRESGYEIGIRLIQSGNLPTGIVFANDLMAIGFMMACEEKGVSIPSDVSIVGMDNSEPAIYVRPKLTSIIMHEEDIGRDAAEMLIERILHGRTIRKMVRLRPELAERESVAPPKL